MRDVSREWKEVKLGDFIEIKHGFAYKGANFSKEETSRILLTPGNFNIGGGFKSDKFKYYDEDAENPSEYILKPNDLLITMTDLSNSGDTLGFPVFIPKIENKIILHNQRTGKVIAKSLKIDMSFIYYLLCTREYRHHVLSTATGTTVRHTAPKRIESYKFNLPPLKEQKAIARILSTLDEKIETNNQINKKLEEMAQTIFKHWFVDFEFPNEDGEHYKSSGGEMVESELGMIPKGWEVGCIDDFGDVIGGSTPSKKKEEYFTDKGIPWITPKDLSENKNVFISRGALDITEEGYKSTSVRKTPKGTVLFSSRAPIGYIAISKNEVTTNQGFKSIFPRSSKGFSSEFVYCWLKENIETIKNRASGSTFKEISGSEMKKIPSIIPEKSILNRFKNIISNAFIKIEVRESENQVLTNFRDILLPKLMSGEIRVPLEEDEILLNLDQEILA